MALFGAAESNFILRFQNVTGSPLVKEILTFKSHSGALSTNFFLIRGTWWYHLHGAVPFTLWFTRILKQTKARMLSVLCLPELLGSGETAAVLSGGCQI